MAPFPAWTMDTTALTYANTPCVGETSTVQAAHIEG